MKAIAKDYFGEAETGGGYAELIERSTHMNLSNLNHEFIQIADYDKIKPLTLLMKEFKKYARKHNTSTMVFCNSVMSARACEHALSEEGYKVTGVHGDIPPRGRERNFEKFKT